MKKNIFFLQIVTVIIMINHIVEEIEVEQNLNEHKFF